MEIPLEVREKYPSKPTYSDPWDRLNPWIHFRSGEEYVNGQKIMVTRYGRNDSSALISMPQMGGIATYVSTLALSKMSR